MTYRRNLCRFCEGTDLFQFLDLGVTPLADAFLTVQSLTHSAETEIFVPLSVLSCRTCGLAQLSQVVSPDVLYDQKYAYDASVTATGRAHWKSLALSSWNRFSCKSNDLVIDIGSNSGELLQHFKELGARELGIDPAVVPTALARSKGINTIVDLFSTRVARQVLSEYGTAHIITATNVFAHIDDVNEFLQCAQTLLQQKGILIIEAPHFLELVRKLEYDTIYHEHLSYLAVKPLDSFVKRHGFRIFDVERQNIHGGSLRYFIAREGDYEVQPIVAQTIADEVEQGLYNEQTLLKFAEAVVKNRTTLRNLLMTLKDEGNIIAAVGAPAKGMTLINYCNLGKEFIDFITEKSPLKIGAYSPGAHIPILSDNELLQQRPAYCLLLAWNFADEIVKNLSEYRAIGGKFIIPIPTPQII